MVYEAQTQIYSPF